MRKYLCKIAMDINLPVKIRKREILLKKTNGLTLAAKPRVIS